MDKTHFYESSLFFVKNILTVYLEWSIQGLYQNSAMSEFSLFDHYFCVYLTGVLVEIEHLWKKITESLESQKIAIINYTLIIGIGVAGEIFFRIELI